ncbi:potassium/sodium hyperpolarization-activated cyclic nucleotide-gated channel 4-like [Atheta coriaria]|uniref:potassium/sodium hyperpolarization-activated cyclic nucleotide-gated channel 4-like n=1 Tax=Dalotia coriaria TaxID=877792 RepID=UPI0031F33897
MNRRYKSAGDHPCKIAAPVDDPNDCWPCLTPRANIVQRIIRSLQIYTLPSYIHPQTKYVYRSISSFRAVKTRMIYQCSPFVLHPYGMLAMIRLLSMFFFMLIYFIMHTFRLYYMPPYVVTIDIFLKIIMGFFIVTQFLIGYVETKNEQVTITLCLKKIAVWNVKRYLFLDVLELCRILFVLIPYQPVRIWLEYIVFHMFMISVIHRFFISRHFSVGALLHSLLGMSHMTLDYVSFLSFIAICVHYLSCFRYGMPRLLMVCWGDMPPPSKTLLEDYLTYTHLILMKLYRAAPFFQRVEEDYYEIIECITSVVVSVLHVYVVVFVLVAARNTNKSKYKYSIMWNNVQAFFKHRNISGKLRYKIFTYYQHKFQFKFFEEEFIIKSLSKHLQYEFQLHACSHLMVNTPLLSALPKVVVGRIVASFKPIVYLPNDVIFNWHSTFDGIYIISYGTVAIYTDQGKEVQHLEDGGVIGATGYFLGTNFFTTTAVTITEVYKVDALDLDRVVKLSPELAIRLKTIGRTRTQAVKGLYADGLNMLRFARQIRQDGRQLRKEVQEEDLFYEKQV